MGNVDWLAHCPNGVESAMTGRPIPLIILRVEDAIREAF